MAWLRGQSRCSRSADALCGLCGAEERTWSEKGAVAKQSPLASSSMAGRPEASTGDDCDSRTARGPARADTTAAEPRTSDFQAISSRIRAAGRRVRASRQRQASRVPAFRQLTSLGLTQLEFSASLAVVTRNLLVLSTYYITLCLQSSLALGVESGHPPDRLTTIAQPDRLTPPAARHTESLWLSRRPLLYMSGPMLFGPADRPTLQFPLSHCHCYQFPWPPPA
ncbi:hypothetical protein BM1_05255 [Bipolaris maydis]|nr:hypothetical protein BM1_05255 [Bipolaris maydis]